MELEQPPRNIKQWYERATSLNKYQGEVGKKRRD